MLIYGEYLLKRVLTEKCSFWEKFSNFGPFYKFLGGAALFLQAGSFSLGVVRTRSLRQVQWWARNVGLGTFCTRSVAAGTVVGAQLLQAQTTSARGLGCYQATVHARRVGIRARSAILQARSA